MTHSVVAEWLPPVIRKLANRVLGTCILYHGPFVDWDDACASTAGYDERAILERVLHATRATLSNPEIYEQDGTTQRAPPPPSNVLPALLLAAAIDDGRLSVLDFGGGLASLFLRWRPYLKALPSLQWHVVEQANFVEAGTQLFADLLIVHFHSSIESARQGKPNVILLSSVLQYLPEPMTVLDALLSLQARVIVIDRTPYAVDGSTYVLTQQVPANLGKASYPLRALSREQIHSSLSRDYQLLFEFDAPDQPIKTSGICALFGGSVWLRRT